jgi:DNA-binding transcriptional regulator PaaX
MKQSLRNRILSYYERHSGQWIASGTLQRLVAEKTTYTPQNVGRRLRELAEDGLLEVEYRDNHAFYRFKEQAQKTRRVPFYEVIEGIAYERFKEVTT